MLAASGELYIQDWIYKLECNARNVEEYAIPRMARVLAAIKQYHDILSSELRYYKSELKGTRSMRTHHSRLKKFTDAFVMHCSNIMMRLLARNLLRLDYKQPTARLEANDDGAADARESEHGDSTAPTLFT